MARWVACMLLLAACSFKSGEAPSDSHGSDGTPHDGPKDVSSEATADAQQCFDAHLDVGHFCLTTEPPKAIHITDDSSLDTTGAPDCDPSPSLRNLCVIAGTSVQIDGGHTYLVKGSKPLVIVSQTTMQIDGTLDIASHRGPPANKGPDASPTSGCSGSGAGNGGGYGGSFGSLGGDGGEGGVPDPVDAPTTLHGGCSGQDGGGGVGSGQRGNGGGAVYLIALTRITITGAIDASGGGGGGAGPGKNAGGGGAGGMIVFDTPTLDMQGMVFANGGGGGEGGDFGPGRNGGEAIDYMNGGDGGGGFAAHGGDGGKGGSSTAGGSVGNAGDMGGGDGGGGGGVGVIYAYGGTSASIQVSPPFSPAP